MSLRELTRDLHHAAEQSPFGQRLAKGDISDGEWCDLCGAYLTVHRALDPWCPPAASRTGELLIDVARALPYVPRHSVTAELWARDLQDGAPSIIAGSAYVLLGAHLMGGSVIRKVLPPALSAEHLSYRTRPAEDVKSWLALLRETPRLAPAAGDAFRRVIGIFNEIDGGPA